MTRDIRRALTAAIVFGLASAACAGHTIDRSVPVGPDDYTADLEVDLPGTPLQGDEAECRGISLRQARAVATNRLPGLVVPVQPGTPRVIPGPLRWMELQQDLRVATCSPQGLVFLRGMLRVADYDAATGRPAARAGLDLRFPVQVRCHAHDGNVSCNTTGERVEKNRGTVREVAGMRIANGTFTVEVADGLYAAIDWISDERKPFGDIVLRGKRCSVAPAPGAAIASCAQP